MIEECIREVNQTTMIKHFGCNLKAEPTKLTRDNYAPITDKNRINNSFLSSNKHEILPLTFLEHSLDEEFEYQKKWNKEEFDHLVKIYPNWDKMIYEEKEYYEKEPLIPDKFKDLSIIDLALINNNEYEEYKAKHREWKESEEKRLAKDNNEFVGNLMVNLRKRMIQKREHWLESYKELKKHPEYIKELPDLEYELNKPLKNVKENILWDLFFDSYLFFGKTMGYLSLTGSKIQQAKALYNFDLNMSFFDSLCEEEFMEEINYFQDKHKEFKEVKDLNEYNNVGGIYVMVLDEYKQVYIGVADNIKKRILEHWRNKKPLDRLIWGNIENSILSVDSFCSQDTTRIFVSKREDYREHEAVAIDTFFPSKFILNRTGGSLTNPMEAAKNNKTRNLL